MRRFLEEENTQRRIFLSLTKLGCAPQKINSAKIHLHWTLKTSWTKRSLLTQTSYFSGGERRRPEIRLGSQAKVNATKFEKGEFINLRRFRSNRRRRC